MTWKDIAQYYPEFVQWVAQKYSTPEGEVKQEDYECYSNEYFEMRGFAK